MKHPRNGDPRIRPVIMLGLGLLCVVLLVHEIFGEHGYLALRRERRDYAALQQQIENLRRENQALESQIKALNSDPKAIEKLARERMGMARPGEIIIAFPDKKSQAENPPPVAKDASPQ